MSKIRLSTFIGEHKYELTYVLDRATRLLTSDDVKNICIAADDAETVQMYLLALKWILPISLSENTGISTYNVYLPSDKQKQIVFHGTIKQHNNITGQAIEARKNCIYIDIENTKFPHSAKSMLLGLTLINFVKYTESIISRQMTQLLDWQATWENTTKTGIGGKLIKLKKSAGDNLSKHECLNFIRL